MKIYIFDIDETILNSWHRQLFFLNGKMDLTYWENNSTRENIFKDTELHLANYMRWLIAEQNTVWILTARVMSEHDVDFLKQRKLMPDRIISRVKGDTRKDHIFKKERMEQIIKSSRYINTANMVFFDDKRANRKALQSLGIASFDPNGL